MSGWVNAQKTPDRDNLTRPVNELGLKAHEITTVQLLSDMTGPEDDALALPHISVQPGEAVAESDAPSPAAGDGPETSRGESGDAAEEADKTLQRFEGGALKLTAANPSYDAEMLMPTDTPRRYRSRSTDLEVNITVLGNVVCYVRPA